jgi:hypothetical protein
MTAKLFLIRTWEQSLFAMLTSPAYHFKRIGLEAGPLSQWLFSALGESLRCVALRDAFGPIALCAC